MRPDTRPNILLIVLDQQRYDCLSPAQAQPVHTPHIAQLGEEGTWFERAYTPIPTCCPARWTRFATSTSAN